MALTPLGPAPLVYAHRGDRSRAADNTLEAFGLAVEAGADGVELDVRQTSDGVLVMSHDPATASDVVVAETSFRSLREAHPEIPTFAETLSAIPGNIYLNVEIKNSPTETGFDPSGDLTRQTIAMITEHDNPERILLSSFDLSTVAAAEGSGLLCGLLVVEQIEAETAIAATYELGVEAIHPPMAMLAPDPSAIVGAMHDAGLSVVVWDANTAHEISAAAEAGCDVIITDDPGLGREVLAQR
ncbi:MAG: glycerophosphodiester phosphodiesterase [Acidimicrobiia bacterium]